MTTKVAALVDPFTHALDSVLPLRLTLPQALKSLFRSEVKEARRIDLVELFGSVGMRSPKTNYPLLAFAPVTAKEIRFFELENFAGFHTCTSNINHQVVRNLHLKIPPAPTPYTHRIIPLYGVALKTAVPPIPRSLMPTSTKVQQKTSVMFDTDWQGYTIDPYLIEHGVNGSNARIVAEWDLTPTERLAMQFSKLRVRFGK
jgi:hypothetical protein